MPWQRQKAPLRKRQHSAAQTAPVRWIVGAAVIVLLFVGGYWMFFPQSTQELGTPNAKAATATANAQSSPAQLLDITREIQQRVQASESQIEDLQATVDSLQSRVNAIEQQVDALAARGSVDDPHAPLVRELRISAAGQCSVITPDIAVRQRRWRAGCRIERSYSESPIVNVTLLHRGETD